jgi:hypothetical protein
MFDCFDALFPMSFPVDFGAQLEGLSDRSMLSV